LNPSLRGFKKIELGEESDLGGVSLPKMLPPVGDLEECGLKNIKFQFGSDTICYKIYRTLSIQFFSNFVQNLH
jgi:hypothetical protein